jgi:hydroxypyruvate isomerase
VQLVGLNFFAGDMPAGDRGVVSWPGRAAEFRENVEAVVSIGEQLGCRAFNALYGNRVDGAGAEEQDELALASLVHAADAVARIDGTVLIEPVSGAPAYPLKTAADALAVIDRVQAAGVTNVGLLADLYHLAVNGDDVDRVIAEHGSQIVHVQIADHPGRNEPGTGELSLDRQLAALADQGYGGWVGLEYKPSGASADSFGWLERARRTTAR